MGIESFFTLQTLQNSGQGKGLPGSGVLSITPAEATPGGPQALFLDLIIERLNEAVQNTGNEAENSSGEDNLLQSGNPLLDKNPKLNLAEILAANPEIKEDLQQLIELTDLPQNAALTQVLALNQKAFDDVLKPLTDGIITAEEIAKGSPRIFQALLIEPEDAANAEEISSNLINKIKAKIQSLIENNKGEGGLITINLTPEELTALQTLPAGFDLKAALKDADLPEDLADKTAILLLQFSAPQNAPVETTPGALAATDPAIQNVLALTVAPSAGYKRSAAAPFAGQSNSANAANGNAHAGLSADVNANNAFTIEDYTGNAAQDGTKNKNAGNFEAALKAAQGAKPDMATNISALQGFPFANPQGFFTTDSALPGGMIDDYAGATLNPAATLSASAAANVITQAAHASAAHPATQLIALNIQKAAQASGDKTLTLQLDPPELGRVHVKMTFGSDKTLKAIVTAEKPETYMMLQRDAQTLERSLQDAGLDTDAGLSFELAEQGFDFDGNDNQRGGGHDKGGTGAGDDAENETLIESTMTWHVDPDTGHMRYNIFA